VRLGLGFSNAVSGAAHSDLWEHFGAKSDLVATAEAPVEAPTNGRASPEVKILVNDDQALPRAQLAWLLAGQTPIRVIDQTTNRSSVSHQASHLL
jgi:hypothetical protein